MKKAHQHKPLKTFQNYTKVYLKEAEGAGNLSQPPNYAPRQPQTQKSIK